jgi:hypothetical protein
MRWKWTVVAVLVAFGSPAAAQVQSRPTDPPLVTAANESWFVLREPVQFAGDLYYPAGAAVFFNGNTMVRTGHYNGVPLYADTTLEPFSIVLVPVSRGTLQPYARLRLDGTVGTTGIRPLLMAAVAPTSPPLSPGAISVFTPESTAIVPAPRPAIVVRDDSVPVTEVVGTTGIAATRRQTAVPVVSLRQPESNDGVWIMFGGEKWVSAGTAVPLVAADFVRVGDYSGFPVFARRDFAQEIIYLPSRAGLVAPYRLKNP